MVGIKLYTITLGAVQVDITVKENIVMLIRVRLHGTPTMWYMPLMLDMHQHRELAGI